MTKLLLNSLWTTLAMTSISQQNLIPQVNSLTALLTSCWWKDTFHRCCYISQSVGPELQQLRLTPPVHTRTQTYRQSAVSAASAERLPPGTEACRWLRTLRGQGRRISLASVLPPSGDGLSSDQEIEDFHHLLESVCEDVCLTRRRSCISFAHRNGILSTVLIKNFISAK